MNPMIHNTSQIFSLAVLRKSTEVVLRKGPTTAEALALALAVPMWLADQLLDQLAEARSVALTAQGWTWVDQAEPLAAATTAA